MKNKKIISLILVIIWMIFIFVMSSFGSVQSDNQSNFIVDIVAGILNIENVDILSYVVRKTAHFVEYLILGVLVYNVMRYYNKKYYLTIMVCVLYAISDEVHQAFVPGRSCQASDMLIDSIGSFVGMLFYYILIRSNKRIKKEKVLT